MNSHFKTKLEKSISALEDWIESHDYMAWEPFDGLSSPLRFIGFGSLFWDRALMQLVRRSPYNLRPLLFIQPLPSTKGRGYMASGYLERYRTTGKDIFKKRLFSQLQWLDENKSQKYSEHSWGNHFPFASRAGRYFAHDSILVWTALIGSAFLDAYEEFREVRYRNVIESVTRWILALPRERTDAGVCISYLMGRQISIHNANMLGAAFLAQAAKITASKEAEDLAKDAMSYSCSCQRQDGSWWYAEQPKYRWIDNFHTGYNLDALQRYIKHCGSSEFSENLEKGFCFFEKNFFDVDGSVKYYNDKKYPIDSQCAAQAIETLVNFSMGNERILNLACKVAGWWIETMQDKDGYFYFRRYRNGIVDKTPMFHWAQATTYKGLARLEKKIASI